MTPEEAPLPASSATASAAPAAPIPSAPAAPAAGPIRHHATDGGGQVITLPNGETVTVAPDAGKLKDFKKLKNQH